VIHYDNETKTRAMLRGSLVSLRDNLDPPRPRWTADLLVDKYGYCELTNWTWKDEKYRSGGWRLSNPADLANYEAEHELLDFLRDEGEWIELRKIGPEDSEYFATEKLMEVINSKE
jgi:hypothetical protein